MNNKEIAELLLPNVKNTPDYYENLYKPRNLKEDAFVVRFAPSPTGFVHMGSAYVSFLNKIYARQTGGVCYLRIEDTDTERTTEDIDKIRIDLENFGIKFDEGAGIGGEYGPYIQSQRKDIYQAYAKKLIEDGLAYPCFCTKKDMEDMRKEQEALKDRTGYYGMYAKCRNLTNDEIEERVKNGDKYIIRLKSNGSFKNKIVLKDEIRGKLSFPENDADTVIIKADGLPTYHFAHVVDDHLMKTTHVIRGEEWLPSLPLHIQMFDTMGFEAPKYVHIAPIGKIDEETKGKRKLSKRKDPECAISYYHEEGIPNMVVMLYLSTLANTNFEEWYNKNPNSSIFDFKFELKKMNSSISLFDMEKLNNISKIYFSRLSANELYDMALDYFEKFDVEFAKLLKENKEYSIEVLNIERNVKKPRKDITTLKDVKNVNWYMYDEIFFKLGSNEVYKDLDMSKEYETHILEEYIDKYYDENATKDEWFESIKKLAVDSGYASDKRVYNDNPDQYKGHVGDVCELIRVAVTSKTRTPDLYDILRLLGKNRIHDRFNRFSEYIKK